MHLFFNLYQCFGKWTTVVSKIIHTVQPFQQQNCISIKFDMSIWLIQGLFLPIQEYFIHIQPIIKIGWVWMKCSWKGCIAQQKLLRYHKWTCQNLKILAKTRTTQQKSHCEPDVSPVWARLKPTMVRDLRIKNQGFYPFPKARPFFHIRGALSYLQSVLLSELIR